ncbi:MAG: PAS domain S-box protein [Bacteroidales bacterium]
MKTFLHALPKSFISIYNQAGKHIEVWGNADIKNLYGLIPGNVKGKLLEDVFSKKNATEIKNQINLVFEQKKSNNLRLYVQFPKGSFWIETSLIPLFGNQQEVTAVIGFFKDVSDRVKREKELIESKEKYRNLIELAPEGIIIVNLRGIITSVNTTLLEMTGIRESDFIGKKLTHIPGLQVEYLPYFHELTQTIIEDGIPGSFEFEWKDRNGEDHVERNSNKPCQEAQQTTRLSILFNDITERKLIQKDFYY